MGIVPEFLSKLMGGKKDVVTPPANNGPSTALPETSVSPQPTIMDPMVTARPPMPETAAPTTTIDAAPAPSATDTAPIAASMQDKPAA